MKNQILAIVCILLLIGCNKTDNTIPDTIESYTDENFIQFEDYLLNPDDSKMLENGSLVVVGNGGELNESSTNPFLLNINSSLEVEKLIFLPYDDMRIFRRLSVLNKDDNLIILSQISEFSSDVDIDIRSLNSSCRIDWHKKLGEDNMDERGKSITQLPNGELVILSSIDAQNIFEEKYLVSKISSIGEIIWNVEITDESITTPSEILYLPEDNSLMIVTEHGLGAVQNGEIKITKLDINGKRLASKSILIDSEFWPRSSGLKLLKDGNLISYYSSNMEFSQPTEFNIIKLRPDLSVMWEKRYDEIKTDIIKDVYETKESEILVLSQSSNIANDEFDIIISRLDSEGEILWRKTYGGIFSDHGVNIYETASGNILVIGASNRNMESDRKFNMFLLVTDKEGNPI